MANAYPNLKVITNRESDRRRLPRLSLAREQFRLDENSKTFSVADLSHNGMAIKLIESEDLQLFPIGKKISGQINLKRTKYPIECLVRHVQANLVGCEFGKLYADTRDAIDDFLDPASLGAELKPAPTPGEAKDRPDIWYYGPSGTELLFWRNPDGSFYRFLLLVFGSYVQWDQSGHLETGMAEPSDEANEVDGLFHAETTVFYPDAEIDLGKLTVFGQVIDAAPLPLDLKAWCLKRVRFD